MHFTMKEPCPNCPFRTDIRPFLTVGRAQEIADSLVLKQQTFQCHKTIDYTPKNGVENDDYVEPNCDTKNAQHCAGAMIMLEKMKRPNQMMRIAERLGLYNHKRLNMEAPVFDDDEAFVNAQER